MLTLPRFFPTDKWLLERIHRGIGQAPIRLVLKDGAEVSPAGVAPLATVLIHDRRTLAGLILDPETGFGEAYAAGRIEVEGDLVGLLETVCAPMKNAGAASWYSKLASRWTERWQANTLRGSRKNIRHHYDLGTNFYKLWLDPQLVYTCAYFPSPETTLEDAQIAKMDYICRKLQLQPGETVVEAGCGWGALAIHMARHYGVSVKAFNVSHEQILFARQRAKGEELGHKVEFIEDDYRNISGRYDIFMSVGMIEHVGADHYTELGDVIHRSLSKSGRGLLHFIGQNRQISLSRWIRKRIFPGAYPPTLRQVMEIFEPWNLSVLDVENLRLHYAKTLEHWLDRFEGSSQQVFAMFDPSFVRTWRLYLAGSLAAFRAGTLQLFQVVFEGPACRGIPWTRASLYSGAQHTGQNARWMHATF